MTVDNGDAVFDGIGNLADGKGLPPFGDYQVPGCVQDTGPHLFFLPLFTIYDSHCLAPIFNLTVLANVRLFGKLPKFLYEISYLSRRELKFAPGGLG